MSVLVANILIKYTFHAKTLNIAKTVRPTTAKKNFPHMLHTGVNIPITMDLTLWGDIITKTQSANLLKIRPKNSKIEYDVVVVDNTHVINVYQSRRKIISLVDELVETSDHDLSTFKRSIEKKIYHYKSGKITLFKEEISCKFINTVNKHVNAEKKIEKFLTMDIETRTCNSIMEPLCISWHDGKTTTTLNIRDFDTPDSMITKAIEKLLVPKYLRDLSRRLCGVFT